MSYIDGFLIAVPTANKQVFIDHANKAGKVFVELGALRTGGKRLMFGGFAPVVTLSA